MAFGAGGGGHVAVYSTPSGPTYIKVKMVGGGGGGAGGSGGSGHVIIEEHLPK